jgi:isoquinoline 1-oxidoreductase beta subunit
MTIYEQDSVISTGVSRRAFLGGGATIVAMFALDAVPGSKMAQALAASLPADAGGANLNGWVAINADNTVTIAFGGAEMGQGILTGLAQAAAEELMVAWGQVRTEVAPTSQSYLTGGSFGIRANFRKMRVAGAQAREVLVAAAASGWGIEPSGCSVIDGIITSTSTGESVTFAQMAKKASALTPPTSPTLTDGPRSTLRPRRPRRAREMRCARCTPVPAWSGSSSMRPATWRSSASVRRPNCRSFPPRGGQRFV